MEIKLHGAIAPPTRHLLKERLIMPQSRHVSQISHASGLDYLDCSHLPFCADLHQLKHDRPQFFLKRISVYLISRSSLGDQWT
jgi:hypothetical protein